MKCFPLKPVLIQSSEPRFIANVRRNFADFPYLHWSTGQRLLILETWCGYWYGQKWFYIHTYKKPPLLFFKEKEPFLCFIWFSRAVRTSPFVFLMFLRDASKVGTALFQTFEPYLRPNLMKNQTLGGFLLLGSWVLSASKKLETCASFLFLLPIVISSVKRKRDLFPEARPASQMSLGVAAIFRLRGFEKKLRTFFWTKERSFLPPLLQFFFPFVSPLSLFLSFPPSGTGILTSFPFDLEQVVCFYSPNLSSRLFL